MSTDDRVGRWLDPSWLTPLADPVALSRVLDVLPFGLHLVRVGPERQLTVVGMNRSARFGFPGGEAAIGADLADVVPVSIRDETIERYRRVFETGTPETHRFETDVRGRHLVIEVTLIALRLHVLVLSIDLTKPVEETNAAEAYSDAILSASPDVIWVATRDLEIRHFQGGELLESMDHAMVVGSNLADIFDAESAAQSRALIARTLDTHELQVDETTIGAGDNERQFETRMVPLGDDEVLAFVREVTDRHRVEAAHQRRAQTDALIAEVSRELLSASVTTLGQIALSTIERLAKFIGADAATLATRLDADRFERTYSWWDPAVGDQPIDAPRIVHADAYEFAFDEMSRGKPDFLPDVGEIAREATAERAMLEAIAAKSSLFVPIGFDGDIVGSLTFYWRAAPADVSGSVQSAFAAIQVIGDTLITTHDRTKAHIALVEADDQLHVIFDALDEGILLTGADRRVMAANRAATEIFRTPHDELIEHRHEVVTLPIREDGTEFSRDELPTHATLRDGKARVNVLEGILTPDGDRRWISMNTRPLVRPGEPLPYAVVSSFADVTERRHLEQQMAQAGKMEALGRLAGGVAHDINNILTAITGYTALLLDDLPDQSPLESDLQEIERAAERAAHLVDQLLSFSRSRVIGPSVTDVRATVERLFPMVRRVVPEAVEIETHFRGAPAMVRADPSQLEQVVLNLAVNAGDAMPHGGRLVFETTFVEERQGEGPFVLLSVSDTGVGMDAAVRARAFEPFFTTKDVGKGTGLGLSTVYGIVTQTGGHVTVYSEPGEGSTFRVYLPVTTGTPRPRPSRAPTPSRGTGDETILLVEDDAAVRALSVETLSGRGFHVIETSDAAHARRAAFGHRGRIDLLLTDVVLPGTKGPELATEMLQQRPGIRILFMSGYAEGVITPEMLDGSAFLAKPFRPDELVHSVRAVLDREEPDA